MVGPGQAVRRVPMVGAMLALVAALATLTARPAAAQPDDELSRDDQIVLNGRLVVPKGQSVGNAAILNGPATVDGTVRETLFVLNGDTDISGTVRQDVVVVNGDVVVRSGAHIGGDLVTQSEPRIERGARIDGGSRNIATRFDAERFGFASRFAWWVGYTVSTLVLGLLLLLLFPAIDAAALRAWRDRAGLAVGLGAAFFFLLPIVAGIFLVTIVGIPLGLFILLALALLYTAGYVAAAHVVGRLIVRPPTSRYLAFLLGWAILRVIGLVPFLGGFVWLIAAIVGLGVLVVAARRAEPVSVPPAAPPPPPPAPVTTPA